MRLGEILLKRGLVTEAQLHTALTQQKGESLRLGTYFIEVGILTTDQVTLALAEQFGVPPAMDADFVRADPVLRKRLVVHQAIELQAIPLFFTRHRRVAVAMANPTNSRALDRLAFILGATVEPMVATEMAMTRQFELLYRVRSKSRSKAAQLPNLPPPHQIQSQKAPTGDVEIRPALRTHRRAPIGIQSPGFPSHESKSQGLQMQGRQPLESKPPIFQVPARKQQEAQPEVLQARDTQPQQLHLEPLEPGAILREPAAPVEIMEDALCFTPTPLAFIPPADIHTPPKPTRLSSRHPLTPIVVPITGAGAQLAVDQIRFATDQQDLSDSLFTFMRSCFGVGAMFSVAGAVARGRFGFSDGYVRPEVENLEFTLSLPSCFRIARSRRSTFRGLPPPDGMAVHQQIWTALHANPPWDILVSPVIVDGHVTLLLYAQDEGGGRINNLAASRMEQVCEALSSSLLRLAV